MFQLYIHMLWRHSYCTLLPPQLIKLSTVTGAPDSWLPCVYKRRCPKDFQSAFTGNTFKHLVWMALNVILLINVCLENADQLFYFWAVHYLWDLNHGYCCMAIRLSHISITSYVQGCDSCIFQLIYSFFSTFFDKTPKLWV